MDAIGAFLSDPANREVLSWIGGGLAVIGGGLWTVVTFFWQPPRNAGEGKPGISYGLSGWPLVTLVAALAGVVVLVVALSGPRVTATDGAVGVGGDNKGTINVR